MRTPKNDQLGYSVIVAHFAAHGKPPSYQTLADALGYASKRSVQLMLQRLENAGLLTGRGPSLQLLNQQEIAVKEVTQELRKIAVLRGHLANELARMSHDLLRASVIIRGTAESKPDTHSVRADGTEGRDDPKSEE